MNILITGHAGFIGYHISKKLINQKKNLIVGIDNFNSYYDPRLKHKRNLNLKKISNKNFVNYKLDINNVNKLNKIFKKYNFKQVIHLAAQAGVRYSIKNPKKYFDSNLKGFFNILEMCKIYKIKHLVVGSSSSVYGDALKFPLTEEANTDKPLSFYAATKKSNEVMAYSYSNIYKIPISVLRFFTVYGSFGRPDMALYKFSKLISDNKPIEIFNKGNHFRDFTYVDVTVSKIIKIKNLPPKTKIPYRILNVANGKPEKLSTFIKIIENNLNKKAILKLLPIQKGDVFKTYASTIKLNKVTGFKKPVSIKNGIKKFITWFKKHNSNG